MVKLGNLSLSLRSLSLDHETEDGDTIASINKYLEDNLEEYRRFRQLGQSIVGEDADIPEKLEIELDADTPTTGAAPEAPKKRGRKSKNQPDPAPAVAPPPAPVPGATVPAAPAAPAAPTAPAAPPAPVDTTPNANGIPAFLDRAAAPPAPAAPVAPVATMAPPPPPAPIVAAPPVGTLAPKIVAELRTRATGSPDGGAGLVAWLAGAALVVPNATFEEAMECLQFLDDAKLGPAATALGIS